MSFYIFKNFSKIFFCLLFILFIGCILGGISNVQALNSNATATLTVTNAVPTASNTAVSNSSPIVLTAGTTTTITATFKVTDNNGCTDIDSNATKVTAKFFRTGVGASCTASSSSNNCYAMNCTQDSSSCTGVGDLDATYTCTVSANFYSEPTDTGAPQASDTWTLDAIPADNAGAATGNTTTTVEMGSLAALDVTTAINYSALALGADTGTGDQTTTVTNEGNRIMDTQVNGYGSNSGDTTHSMACTIGSIAIGNEKYSLTGATAYGSKTALTGTAFQIVSFNLSPTTTGSAATKPIYWGMGLPANGVGGSCSGTVVFTAVNH